MRKWFIAPLFALAALGASFNGFAGSDALLDLGAIRVRQSEIHADASAATGIYKDMPKATRDELLSRQAQVLAAIEGKSDAAELTEQQRADVAGNLAWIDNAVDSAEDNRMVCERRKKLGSNRTERVCMTVAQQREQRERAREQMDRRGICADCGGDG